MYVLENPVLQRELLVNLRMVRAFVLLLLYQALLAAVVYFAWPQESRLDLTTGSSSSQQTRRLVDLFFIGQYVIASMMAPSFAAGSITGEKERKTYEMLLASPLRPAAIVLGKLVASLTHLSVLIFASLPLVTLRNQQVTIDLFAHLIPGFIRPALQAVIQVVSGLCMAVIAWRLWVKGGQMIVQGDTTAVLQLKVWPLVYFMSVLAAVTAVILLLMIRQKGAAGGSGEV